MLSYALAALWTCFGLWFLYQAVTDAEGLHFGRIIVAIFLLTTAVKLGDLG